MRNVSREFKDRMAECGDFYYTADIMFADGRKVSLGKEEFYIQGNGLVESPDSNSFPLGTAITKRLALNIDNSADQYAEFDFINAVIQIKLKFALSKTTETINLGKYTVVEPESYGSTVSITAADDMYKADKGYSTGLSYPVTMGAALRDSCASCGLMLLDTNPRNSDYLIKQAPADISHRQFIGLCAMIAGGNAVCDEYGRVKIITYDFSKFETTAAYDGGVFDGASPYASGDNLDGGGFSPWNQGDVADAGAFLYADDCHVFSQYQNCTVATDDVQITGIKTTVDEVDYTTGTEGYMLSLENPLFTGNEQDAVNRIGVILIGLKFRPFTIDHVSYPLAEFGDLCYIIDRKGKTYRSVITDIDFSFYGFTVLKCSADNPIRNSSRYANPVVQAVIAARRETEKQISDYDLAVQSLTSLITQSFGVYKTEEPQEDGSTIYYLHNKPTLAESDTIWKMTGNAFAVSTDSGKTWNAGMSADGNAVVKVLSAIGISFDWARGGTLTLGGNGNKNGELRILDASGKEVGRINNTGADIVGTFLSRLGSEWMKIKESVLTGGYLGVTDGLLDLSAQYDDGTRNVVLEAITGKTIIKGRKGVRIGKETSTSRDVDIADVRISGMFGDETEGLLDLSAAYSDGRHAVLESKTGKTIINSRKGIVLDGLELKNCESGTYPIGNITSITVTNGIITNIMTDISAGDDTPVG